MIRLARSEMFGWNWNKTRLSLWLWSEMKTILQLTRTVVRVGSGLLLNANLHYCQHSAQCSVFPQWLATKYNKLQHKLFPVAIQTVHCRLVELRLGIAYFRNLHFACFVAIYLNTRKIGHILDEVLWPCFAAGSWHPPCFLCGGRRSRSGCSRRSKGPGDPHRRRSLSWRHTSPAAGTWPRGHWAPPAADPLQAPHGPQGDSWLRHGRGKPGSLRWRWCVERQNHQGVRPS